MGLGTVFMYFSSFPTHFSGKICKKFFPEFGVGNVQKNQEQVSNFGNISKLPRFCDLLYFESREFIS